MKSHSTMNPVREGEKESMAITIKQIAVKAGVSRGTVDRVLHNRGGVKPDIAEHVRMIAQELGYKPNRAARLLAARKQPVKIGCMLPAIGNPFFDEVIKGIYLAREELADFGVTVCVKQIRGYDTQEHMQAIRELVEREKCNALCLSTIDTPEIRAYVNRVCAQDIPVVAFNTDLTDTKRICYVGTNYFNGGSTAAGLLASVVKDEKQRILVFTGSLRMKGHNERLQGFTQTLGDRRVPYEIMDIFETQDSDEVAHAKALMALSRHNNINCIYMVAAGAAGVCRAVEESGLTGADIVMIANDAVPSTKEYLRKGIIRFTICQEPVLQGYRAVQRVFDYIMGDEAGAQQDWFTDTVIKVKENLDAEY